MYFLLAPIACFSALVSIVSVVVLLFRIEKAEEEIRYLKATIVKRGNKNN